MAQAKQTNHRQDIFAGLTSATVILPKAMAYASVAGLSVAVGLYTALVPILIYAFFGTSRVLSFTSTTTLAILTAVELDIIAQSDSAISLSSMTATLSLLVGAVLILAALLRLGFLANFISMSVLIGFKAGIGLVIVLDQIPKLLGLHIVKQNFFLDLVTLWQSLPQYSLPTLTVAAGTFILFFILKKITPQWPVSLIVVAAGIFASWYLGLSNQGVSIIGAIPQGLPPLTLPSFSLITALIPGALGIALMSFTESAAVARAFQKTEDPPLNSNRELIASGFANAIGSLFGAMPSGGGASQTAVVRAAGGVSQKSNLVVAAVSLATLLLLAPLLGLMPNATLAAIVIIYSVGLIQLKEFIEVRNIRTMEFRWAVAACLGVLIFGTLQGIAIAIFMSLIGLANQTANPRVSVLGRKRGTSVLRPLSPEHPDDEQFEGLLIIRPEGRVYFLNAHNIAGQINALIAKHKPEILLMDMSRVPDIEYSALKMLMEGDDRLTSQGGIQWYSALNPSVLDVVRRAKWDLKIEGRMFFNADIAINKYLSRDSSRYDGGEQLRSATL